MADLTALALGAVESLSVAEIHGAVCGMAAASDGGFDLDALVELVGIESLRDEQSVGEFVNAAIDALQAEDLSFAPLLPDDEADLELRLQALGEWCGAFLAGFASGSRLQEIGEDKIPEEAREIIADFTYIANVDGSEASGGEDAESAERDYVEVHEYVKVGALLLRSLMGGNAPDEQMSS
ncbi:MAG: UPF0149 family protein [Pseudomonadales bacterium]|nr:UPF0149 family protein [Pseudomonadales bacterium]NIX07047.1 UPF0149 family protein [Pseudomonadales bacterium]